MNFFQQVTGMISLIQRLLDAALVGGVLYGTATTLQYDWDVVLTLAVSIAVMVFWSVGEIVHLYSSWRFRTLDDEFRTVFIVWSMASCAVVVAVFLTTNPTSHARLTIVVWLLLVPTLLLVCRTVIRGFLRWLRRRGINARNVCIAGSGANAERIIERLRHSANVGVNFVGVFDDEFRAQNSQHDGNVSEIAGSLDDLVNRARAGQLHYVFVAIPLSDEKRISNLVRRLADTTVSVFIVPNVFLSDLMRARWTMLMEMPAVSVFESPFDGVNGWLKRTEDLVLASVCLVLAAVPMLVIAAGIRMTTNGSILFRQKRYGLNGQLVEVFKFRTMNLSDDGSHFRQVQKDDPNVTPFGRILRSTSLDELPQLFNVLNGSMSLVGPRPFPVAANEHYRPLIYGYMLRHKVKPGITGWAQVNGWRGETDSLFKMQRRVDHDLEYVRNWSVWFDLKILVMTVRAVLSRKNAY
jgi:putative colanic acid biosynthesis UDP-glucose lipid carrier transferase